MTRKDFLAWMGLMLLGLGVRAEEGRDTPMPSLFLGHGSPMNLVEENAFTSMLKTLGRTLRQPKAILVVSAHWYTPRTFVSNDVQPELLYDFFGFPDPLYAIRYDAPGNPELAEAIAKRIGGITPRSRRIDHGVWALLHHLYPEADIPVLQLSINSALSMQAHLELGRDLACLRREGVLIIGSGNVTHNLGRILPEGTPPPDWARDFDRYVSEAVATRDFDALVHYERAGASAALAHPTPEHFIPLLYTVGMAKDDEAITPVFEGFQNGSISMRGWMVGEA